ncbi:hypothetical protein [Jannaschia sp. CCS1]|uniref:hypothetical protein n=1 Tax=Jannaschia sp. (strain CCS1) TaxID=290400 RepID=UPI000053ACF4|nr:hypothetical protein [Jannaschia sp. CCS1]ABD55889.1 hypothetical protein Jann_2972 [Jannaschia sp. CCS1]
MKRAVLCLIVALCVPVAAIAQSGFTFGASPGLRDTPRALELFDDIQGYADLAPERHGTVDQPLQTELGTHLLLRAFRNVCLGIEQGRALADVMPGDFAPYVTLPYSFGDIEEPDYGPGRRVLSSTGSIDTDEDEGRPFIWLAPDPAGLSCRIEWHIDGNLPEARQHAIASYLDNWVPWQFALVHGSRPVLGTAPMPSHVSEWDRPCGDRWCPLVILYSFVGGQISVETVLNITDIEGDLP